MGLGVSHGCFRGGYGQFQYFRRSLAEVVGIPLQVMEGYYDADDWMACAVGNLAGERLLRRLLEPLPVSWKAWEDDPITLLLNHSDCGGELRWQDAVAIAERLEEIAPQIVHLEDMRDDWNFKETALEFAAGLRLAAELEEDVTFR
jgi:hypothetical protein